MPNTGQLESWDEIRSRVALRGLHVWLPEDMKPNDDLIDWAVLYEWDRPDDEGYVAIGLDRYAYSKSVFDLAREGYRRWPECEEHKLFINMGPLGRHSGTYFCCTCGLDFDMVAKKISVPHADGFDEDVMVVTIVRPK